MRDVVFIVNPASSNGRTGRRWPGVSARLGAMGLEHVTRTTEGVGHATELCAAAVAGGAASVVAVGGDGTLNEVANGFFQAGDPPAGVALGLMPLGTGGDFRRTLEIPTDVARAGAIIAARRLRRIDAGRIEMTGIDGTPYTRHFVNIADSGLGGQVVERVNRTSKALGGRISFQYASLATLLTYRPQAVSVRSEEGSYEGAAESVVVANGRYFGGGMWIAPRAEPDDGLFDVVVMGDLGRVQAIRSMNSVYKGKHLENPAVHTWRTARLKVDSPERVLVDVDGEMCGTLPATFTVLPAALEFIVP
jgi:diacylglycerol kinase (ATP)